MMREFKQDDNGKVFRCNKRLGRLEYPPNGVPNEAGKAIFHPTMSADWKAVAPSEVEEV